MYFLLLLLLVKVRYEVTIRLLRTYRANPKATLVILILKEIMYNPKHVIQGELLATSSSSKCLISTQQASILMTELGLYRTALLLLVTDSPVLELKKNFSS